MEITVVSMETIKPSSPTPQHLQHMKLSGIDQYMIREPHVYIHVLLFFSAQGDVNRFHVTDMSNILKKSLPEVLTEFYPLAGKLHDNQSVHCNDQGLDYVEARVKAPLTLRQLLSSPQSEELDQLFPLEAHLDKLSAVRVTIFDACGGMAIGVSLSHVVADASSLAMFINSWAAIARGDAPKVPVTLGFASLFPPSDAPKLEVAHSYEAEMPQRKPVTKRFVFDQMKIDALKANFDYHRPTRVEVTFALLFKCWINVAKSSSERSVAAAFAINLRSRMSSPPSPMHYFGNLLFSIILENAGTDSLNDVGHRLRKLMKEIDSEFFERLTADNARLLSETLDDRSKLFMEKRVFIFTSWCRLPFYEVDFGWGVPTWVASYYPNVQDDVVLLVDAKDGHGVEAWMTLNEDDMAQFESDVQLLDFVCPDPIVYDQY